MPTELERSARALGLAIERFALALAEAAQSSQGVPIELAEGALPSMLTVDEVAQLAGVPRSTLYGWRQRGVGPRGTRFGKYLRFRRDEVERWLAEGGA